MKQKKPLHQKIYPVLVGLFGLVMIYPLVWMLSSSFKESNSIFVTAGSLLPNPFSFKNYSTGWKGFSGISFGRFFGNSLFISVAATVGTVFSSVLVAFAMARCRFPGRNLLFGAMLATMMMPGQILMIPQYLWYNQLGWVGTYLPLIVPFWFAIQGFFVYLVYNFIDGIPKELDEAAKIDGCSFYGIFGRIILPLVVPAMITVTIFSFIWRWDDFLGALLYVNESARYPASLALKLFSDPSSGSDYGAMFAMATLSLLPVLAIFISLQKYLVDGIATSGLKG